MSELARLTGVGPKRLKALEASGILTLRDLVYYLPRRYVDRTRITPIQSLREGMDAFFPAHIESADTVGTRLVLQVSDETGSIELVFFRGLHFLKQRLRIGKRISIAGPVSYFRNFQIAHPEWEELEEGQEPRGGILPVYPMTEEMEESRVNHELLQRLALETLDEFAFSDSLSASEKTFLNLRSEIEALRILHAPKTFDSIFPAFQEMKVRELWPLSLKREAARRERLNKGRVFPAHPQAEETARSALPFTLTKGQEETLQAIHKAFESKGQFFGLLHGDVGSGKTAVALLAAVRVMAAGVQAVLLAPTEILVEQHFRSTAAVLKAAGFESALLTASTPAEERTRILQQLQDGRLSFVVGTHSLLSSGVTFKELRLVLVDEQHRFGVEQRAVLSAKGVEPHVLYLSATPIPRTLAQSLYGDLDVLTLSEKPPGRLPVKTRLVAAEKEKEMLSFLVRETESGNQVYWVVPRIDADDKDSDAVAAIESAVKRLRNAGKWRVEAVHGRVPSQERERILSDFRKGEIHALVATTVIEVGVDVPGANLMVVEGAERFGLAQLHQLRGRTGRGQSQAWCFLLMPQAGWPVETEERLREFASTEDGFRIAEMDLQRRGAGSLDGTRQSGFGLLRFTDLIEDAELIRELQGKAREWIHATIIQR